MCFNLKKKKLFFHWHKLPLAQTSFWWVIGHIQMSNVLSMSDYLSIYSYYWPQVNQPLWPINLYGLYIFIAVPIFILCGILRVLQFFSMKHIMFSSYYH